MAPPRTDTETPAASPPGSRPVWVIKLPYERPPVTLNTINKHWSSVRKITESVARDAYYLAKAERIPTQDRITVTLIYWPGNNTVHDADNMAMTLKPLIDGLRKAGVVPDDRGRHVVQAAMRVIEKDDDREQRSDARMALVIRAV